MKMWSGRFKDSLDAKADLFNSSLPFDKRLYKHDIMGSIAHCSMLGECGIIPQSDAELICKTLSDIFYDIKSAKLKVKGAEDIHMFIEEELTKRIGDVGKKLHTARSRNDQVALDLRLYLRDAVDSIAGLLKNLIETIIKISNQNLDTIVPAYTHMQKAQPTTLAHYLMAYAEMFMRDVERLAECKNRINIMPLGSCACTSTSYPIDRRNVAKRLDFDGITENSLDAVSDRDFAIEFLSDCAVLMMHLSRFNEEIIYWASDEFGYIELDDKFSTGSSIMPQKKNPDMCELIRGKTGRCYGNLMALLTSMKALPLAYNKDMQEDKEVVFDTEDTVKICLEIFTAMLPSFKYNKEKLRKGAERGYTAATECADYLVKKGAAFRDAHAVVGRLVRYCSDIDKQLDEISIDEYKIFSDLFEDDIMQVVKPENILQSRKAPGSPSEKAVKNEIKKAEKFLKTYFVQPE
ncbi:MAG: argininosuccinate lyase [Clostridia bacterium]|nr:argininosuccinate lyase [Clostridia bacterium]